MEDHQKALSILKSNERAYEDLEWLSYYLLCLEDFFEYSKTISRPILMQLTRNLSVSQYNRKQILFKKGEFPETWFIVFEGELELFYTVGSENKLIRSIPKGKQFGEREILRKKSYPYTCFPNKPTFLITLPQAEFISLLGDQLNNRLIILRDFASFCLPHLSSYSLNFKEKIGYSFNLAEYKRGEIVINESQINDKLFFVFEGEAAVSVEENSKIKNIVKLGVGMCFAEECTLLGRPSYFTIRISSERAVIASMSKSEVFNLPEETIETLKKNLKDKVLNRKNLILSNKKNISNVTGRNTPVFKSANRKAREKLMNYILRNRPSTPKRMLNISRIENQKFREKLEELRDCSPSRLRMSPILFSKKQSTGRREQSKSSYLF